MEISFNWNSKGGREIQEERMARVDLGGKKSGSIWMKRPEGRAKDR